jgi:hypothetical protein
VRQDILKEIIVCTSGTKPRDDVPVYDMRHLFDQRNREHALEQLSNMRNFLGSCVMFLNAKKSLQVLQSLLEK